MTLYPQLERYVRALPLHDEGDDRQDLGGFLRWLLRRAGHTIRPARHAGSQRRSGDYPWHIDLTVSRPSPAPNAGTDAKSMDPAEEDRAIEELARVVTDRDVAEMLTRTAGFPPSSMPVFERPDVYWHKVAEEARNGVLMDGIRPILVQAAKRYPSNEIFARSLDTSEPIRSLRTNTEDLMLLVLEHGDVGKSEWDGLRQTLEMLYDTSKSAHRRWLPSGVELGGIKVVVVHNGEFDARVLTEQRETYKQRFEKAGFEFEWWSVHELVARTLTVLGQEPDAQLFSPKHRAFYGVLLDALHTKKRILVEDVDRLLDARLPRGEVPNSGDVQRALTELSLFAAVLANDSKAREAALLDLIDALLRIIVRCMASTVELEDQPNASRAILAELLSTFVDAGSQLAGLLERIAGFEDGLALMGHGELIDWPLRTTRFVRDLVLAARAADDLAAYETNSSDERPLRFRELAERCVACSVELAKNNLGGLATPIMDDQLIEFMIICRTWIDHGHAEVAGKLASEMIGRLVWRRRFGDPGPSLYQSGGTPVHESDARLLVEAWDGDRQQRPPEFEDRGSTLIPVALFVMSRLGSSIGPSVLPMFGVIRVGEQERSPVHLQSWLPPQDAPRRWYGGSLRHTGTCRVYSSTDLDTLFEQLLAARPDLPPSPADDLGLASIDAMAWVLWRTRPPLRWLLDELSSKPGNHADS